jgi:hypothetical protein
MPTLAEVQRRLWQLISAPDGVAAALAAEGDAEGRQLAGWIVDDAQLAAPRRLEVYANAYFQRIHDCLARDFGALAALVGEAGFHDLVTAYLIAHPSRHPSLRYVGEALPDYLARADAAVPFRRRWPWAADLARLEWALGSVFDAADSLPLRRAALATVSPESWGDLVLRFRPTVALVETQWPVRRLYVESTAQEAPDPPTEPCPEAVCIWRRDERVRHRALEPLETALLAAALGGAAFGDLCSDAAERVGNDRAPTVTAELLGRWIDEQLIAAESVPDR